MKNLESLIAYKNNDIIERYQQEHPNAGLSADAALTELMKYIWLCRTHAQDKAKSPNNTNLDFKCVMHDEMRDIDNMWHTFLLFTREYLAFCHEYLNGEFFHHDPMPRNTSKPSSEAYVTELRRYLSYIHEQLGEETLVTWFRPVLQSD